MLKRQFPPPTLYYGSVYFDNNYVLVPNIFVRPSIDEVFALANSIVLLNAPRYQKIRARKLEYVDSFVIDDDFYHPVPQENQKEWTPEFNREQVVGGEAAIPNALVTILIGKITNKRDKKFFPKGDAFFLDEWYHTSDPKEARELMKKSDLPLFIPAQWAHLYKPTEEVIWSGWN